VGTNKRYADAIDKRMAARIEEPHKGDVERSEFGSDASGHPRAMHRAHIVLTQIIRVRTI
jgi:hypothetical protein